MQASAEKGSRQAYSPMRRSCASLSGIHSACEFIQLSGWVVLRTFFFSNCKCSFCPPLHHLANLIAALTGSSLSFLLFYVLVGFCQGTHGARAFASDTTLSKQLHGYGVVKIETDTHSCRCLTTEFTAAPPHHRSNGTSISNRIVFTSGIP